jgi:hypothetical protein
MYNLREDNTHAYNTVGAFTHDKYEDFKNGIKSLYEGFANDYNVNIFDEIGQIAKADNLKEEYKNRLFGDILNEQFSDPYFATMPAKLEQLVENTLYEIAIESSAMMIHPAIGLTLPILKKNYIEGHSKDIIMTEVATKPVVKVAFERKFLKDKAGNKYYIPEIYYDTAYKSVLLQGQGDPVFSDWLPELAATLPIQDYNLLGKSGGSIDKRDRFDYNLAITDVTMTVSDGALPVPGTEDVVVSGLDIRPDPQSLSNMPTNNTISYRLFCHNLAGTKFEDILIFIVDQYKGFVSVSSTAGLVKKVKFGGRLSNENNYNSLELDREREQRQWSVSEKTRFNTGLTIEKIKDYKVLLDIDITTEYITDISTNLTQAEDSDVLDYLRNSYDRWKLIGTGNLPFGYTERFTEEAAFSCTPPAGVPITPSMWIANELKYNMNRLIDRLKVKLKNADIMFVLYGHPNVITLIQDDVKWVIDEDTQLGGVQLDYRFGVMTTNKSRIHVVSTLKEPEASGFRLVLYPLTKEIITFKHYKYSINIENIYRNPLTPLTPNIMGTSRYETIELLPIQGKMTLTNNSFGIAV